MAIRTSIEATSARGVYVPPSIILLSVHRPLSLLETFSIEIEVDDFEPGDDL